MQPDHLEVSTRRAQHPSQQCPVSVPYLSKIEEEVVSVQDRQAVVKMMPLAIFVTQVLLLRERDLARWVFHGSMEVGRKRSIVGIASTNHSFQIPH